MRERRLTRLKGYDYIQSGYYFITACTLDRREWLGVIKNGTIMANEYGTIVSACWNDLPNHYANAKLDEFIVIPNHVHVIIIINPHHNVETTRWVVSKPKKR